MRNRLLLLIAALVVLSGCQPEPYQPFPLSEGSSPLEPCPSTSNCVRESIQLDGKHPPEVFALAQKAAEGLNPVTISADDSLRLHAVYRVLVFRDDVHLAVEPAEDASILHIRSASRVGQSDLGVNRGRVNDFYRELESLLPN